MATFRSVIEAALLELAVLAQGEEAESVLLDNGLSELSGLTAQWAAEGALAFPLRRVSFAIEEPSREYSVGASDGDLRTGFAVHDLRSASYRPRGRRTHYLLEKVSWEALASRSSPDGGYPSAYYFDTNPDGLSSMTLNASTFAGDSLRLAFFSALSAAPALESDTGLPALTEYALAKSLAVALAPAHGKQASRETVRAALIAKNTVRKRHRQPATLRLDPALGRMNQGADQNWLFGHRTFG